VATTPLLSLRFACEARAGREVSSLVRLPARFFCQRKIGHMLGIAIGLGIHLRLATLSFSACIAWRARTMRPLAAALFSSIRQARL
jgi:hypothetical protein